MTDNSILDREPQLRTYQRRVMGYDQVVSFLMTLILMAGAAVVFLLALWITNRIFPRQPPALAMEILSIQAGEEEGMLGNDPELGENALPNADQAPVGDENLQFEDSEVVNVLTSVLDVVAENQVDLSDPSQVSGPRGSGKAGAPGGLGRKGTGSGRGGTPNHARWDVSYPSQSLTEYAQALDFFKVELGVVVDGKVTYYTQLAKGRPISRVGTGADDRMHFVWQDPRRRKADADLLKSKGIEAEGAMVAHFVSPELEAMLTRVEQQASTRPVEQVKKTRFGVRSAGSGGFELYVIEQSYIN